MGSEETGQSSTQDQPDNMSRSIEGLASRIARLEARTNKSCSSDDLYSGDVDIKAEPHLVSCSSSETGRKTESKKSVKDTQVDISTSMERLASRMTSLEATVQTLCILVKDLKESFPKFVTPYVKSYTRPLMDEEDVGMGLFDD